MCVSSVVSGYGQQYPDLHWTKENWPPFRDLLEYAQRVDQQIGEPDCIDPDKEAWMKRIEERISKLEAAQKTPMT